VSVYDRARDLADAIIASEESLRMADALALAGEGQISGAELNEAVNDYNALINEALDIVRMSAGMRQGCGNCRGERKGE